MYDYDVQSPACHQPFNDSHGLWSIDGGFSHSVAVAKRPRNSGRSGFYSQKPLFTSLPNRIFFFFSFVLLLLLPFSSFCERGSWARSFSCGDEAELMVDDDDFCTRTRRRCEWRRLRLMPVPGRFGGIKSSNFHDCDVCIRRWPNGHCANAAAANKEREKGSAQRQRQLGLPRVCLQIIRLRIDDGPGRG